MANTIDSIGDNALIDQIISKTITEIKDDKLLIIGIYALAFCPMLSSVELSAATNIGYYAFSNCANLTSVKLPAVTRIGSKAFGRSSKLTDIYLSAAQGEISGAPWGATKATIHYNYDFSQDGGE